MANKLSGYSFRMKTIADDLVANSSAQPSVGDFIDIGGFQSNSLDHTASVIDITDKDSQNMTILNERGVLSLSASGEGFVEDSSIMTKLTLNQANQRLRWFSFEREDGVTFIARFKIESFNQSGDHGGALTFSASFSSSGHLTIEHSGGAVFSTQTNRFTSFSTSLANFDVINTHTGDYDESDRDVFVQNFVDNLSLLNADKVSRTGGTAFDIDGSNVTGQEGYPVFFIKKSDLNNRFLQAQDGTLGTSIDVVSLVDKTDDTGVEWRAFYVPRLRGNGETLSIELVLGEV